MKTSIMLSIVLVSSFVRADSKTDILIARTKAMPDVVPALAERAALAAIMVETERVPAEVLIAIAWGESRFDPTVKTGHVCGPMQTVPKSPHDCERWTEMLEGFRAGRDELEDELAHDRRVHGDLRLALLAYACGNAAFDGTCSKTYYPDVIFSRAKRLGWHPRSARTAGS